MSDTIHTIGRRKRAVARIYLQPGEGKVTVNGRPLEEYFQREAQCRVARHPLVLVEKADGFDVKATARGGGASGQAGALSLGIARALAEVDPELRPVLKKAGLLTRDSREVERKKPGQPGARKKFQFSKRSSLAGACSCAATVPNIPSRSLGAFSWRGTSPQSMCS